MRIVNCHAGRWVGALLVAAVAVTSRASADVPLSGRLYDQQRKTPLSGYWIEWSTADSIEAVGRVRSHSDGRFRFDASLPSGHPIDLVVLDPDRRPVGWVPGIVPRLPSTVLAIAVPQLIEGETTAAPPEPADSEQPRKKRRFRRWLASPGGSTVLVVVLASVVAVGVERLTEDSPSIADNPSPSSP